MTPEGFSSVVIWLSSLVFPLLVFFVGNSFRSRAHLLVRFAVAIGIGWALIFASAVAAHALNISVASAAELSALYERDGAPLAFAAVFGWLPATLFVAIAWLFRAYALRKEPQVGR